MRVNIYAEELTDRIEIISKEIDGHKFTGLRFYLELPVTVGGEGGKHKSIEGPNVYPPVTGKPAQVTGPFIHRPGDDDSAAVTFWGKQDLRIVLQKALEMLDKHYDDFRQPDPVLVQTECFFCPPPGFDLYIDNVRCESPHLVKAGQVIECRRKP
jgi:hypothetical protein